MDDRGSSYLGLLVDKDREGVGCSSRTKRSKKHERENHGVFDCFSSIVENISVFRESFPPPVSDILGTGPGSSAGCRLWTVAIVTGKCPTLSLASLTSFHSLPYVWIVKIETYDTSSSQLLQEGRNLL